MFEDQNSDIFTIGVGGAAGDGIKKAGVKIGAFLQNFGYEIYMSLDYPSLIRGGHNFTRISFGKSKIWNDYSKLDMLIASNEESIELHKAELKENAIVLSGLTLFQIIEKIESILKEKNIVPADPVNNFVGPKKELIDGNTAFAKGLMAAGLDFYFAYPMTPSTSILHYLAGQQKKNGLRVVQPENEIAVINMALGAAYAGKRAAIGSASGGFALMQEAFSLAGQAELPLVVAVSQRQAPATGVPTRSSQSDLRFVIHAGHGEFPRIVLAPGDPEESFWAGTEALNLAWKFRVPVIVLLDKILSEHMVTANTEKWRDEKMEKYENAIFPGTSDKVVKVTSYEHDTEGITTDKAENVRVNLDRRFEKMEKIREETQLCQGSAGQVKIYGDENNEIIVVFFGSTKGPVLEASKYFNKPVKLVQIVWLEPFPAEKLKKEIEGRHIICVEANKSGQLASLIREKTGIEIADKILKYDSLPFDPLGLAEQINNTI